MGKLEEIERKQESQTPQLEQETEDVTQKIKELDKKIDDLENAIKAISDDEAVRASLNRTLNERQQEKQQEEKRARDIELLIEDLSSELDEYEDINKKSRDEVTSLQAVEDVSDALSFIDQRESWINQRRDKISDMKDQLKRIG
ncbi:MAG: hypothetical protein FP831_01275 [Anaerolineae bacterium]|nr:hypothetical protein [Anaerolineae bacterium]